MEKCLALADNLIALFLIFPLCCLFWRGSWDLVEFYIFQGREPLCYWTMSAIGFCTVFNYLSLPIIDHHLKRQSHLYVPLSRLFLYFHSLLYMSFWRGVWGLYNYYLGTDWRWSLLHLCPSLCMMMTLKVLRTSYWPPLHISVDKRPNLLIASNRFKVNPSNKLLYTGDCFFSAIIVECLSMLTWRSVINVMDSLIYPSDYLKSNIVCVIFGASGAIIMLFSQSLIAKVSGSLHNYSSLMRLLWEDIWCLLAFFFLSSLWRGGWNLNKVYFIPELPLGAWVNHILGLELLLLSQTFSCMSSFGILIDGDNSPGSPIFSTRYIRYFLDSPSDHDYSELENEAVVTANEGNGDRDQSTDEYPQVLPEIRHSIQYNTFTN